MPAPLPENFSNKPGMDNPGCDFTPTCDSFTLVEVNEALGFNFWQDGDDPNILWGVPILR